MRSTVLSLILLVFFLSNAQAKEQEFLVTKVLDGDTIMLENGDIVRYIGVETPELGKKDGGPQFYAREAAKYNKQLVLLKKVRLEFDKERKDDAGRTLAYVYVKNTFVNGELVRLGYARTAIHPPNIAHRGHLAECEREAIRKDNGLWQEVKKETEPYYIGNKHTYVFHKPSCAIVNRMPEKNRIIFRNRPDPIKIGYTPCKKCRP
jgi:micrococcal nuclease